MWEIQIYKMNFIVDDSTTYECEIFEIFTKIVQFNSFQRHKKCIIIISLTLPNK